MKTRYQLSLSLALAALFAVLNFAALGAMPLKPGEALAKRVYNAPVKPHGGLRAHSDEWTAVYLDKNGATSFHINSGNETAEPIRGGMASEFAKAKPILPHTGIAPHSPAWDAFYFDRSVNTHLPNLWNSNLPGLQGTGAKTIAKLGKGISRWDLEP